MVLPERRPQTELDNHLRCFRLDTRNFEELAYSFNEIPFYPKNVAPHKLPSAASRCANRLISDHEVTRLLYARASCAQPLRSQTVYNLYARSLATSAWALALRKISPAPTSPFPSSSSWIIRCITSHTVRRLAFGFHASGNSSRFKRCTLPALASSSPASTRVCTEVFLAFESVSAIPYSAAFIAYCSNQAMAQRVSASYSPSCSASASSSARLINCRAVRTRNGVPSDSTTLL